MIFYIITIVTFLILLQFRLTKILLKKENQYQKRSFLIEKVFGTSKSRTSHLQLRSQSTKCKLKR